MKEWEYHRSSVPARRIFTAQQSRPWLDGRKEPSGGKVWVATLGLTGRFLPRGGTFARTGDELWLERARSFAMHALAQAERISAASAEHHYSLFTGDLGAALFAAACLDADARFPIVDSI